MNSYIDIILPFLKQAGKIALKNHCLALVNGENVGQVASQTLESIQTIEQVTSMPVIRPLAIFDKQDIVNKNATKYFVNLQCMIFSPCLNIRFRFIRQKPA